MTKSNDSVLLKHLKNTQEDVLVRFFEVWKAFSFIFGIRNLYLQDKLRLEER